MVEATRKRDPERRRREIIDAAVALMVEEGSDALTHRKVAARAGVPLGSTTQYFATLDDLRAASMRTLMDEAEEWLAELEAEFVREGASAAAYAAAVHRYLSDPQLVGGDFAMTCAAQASPTMRELCRHWTDLLVDTLSRHVPRENARAVAMFTDGACMDTVVAGGPVDPGLLERTVSALWSADLGTTEGPKS